MYATTDELWFDEWEHGGPPWGKDNRESYEKHSPHRYADKFKTPMLIIHNDLDFRVPVGEGLQLFTTLQRQGNAVASSSTSPTRATGCSSRRTANSGTRRCSPG